MAKRKDRTLQDLYNVTPAVPKPEVNPNLIGSCRMQGPVDDTDSDVQTNTASSEVDEGFSRCSKNQKVGVRAEAGTCNVCFAPCSSCLHIMRTLMGSKADELSEENYGENECKSTLKTSEMGNASLNCEMLSKLSPHETAKEGQQALKAKCYTDGKSFMKKIDNSKCLEELDNNISCMSEVNGANKLCSHDVKNVEKINVPCSSASESCSLHDGDRETLQRELSSASVGLRCSTGGCQNYSRMQGSSSKEHAELLNPLVTSSSEFSVHDPSLMGIANGAGSTKGELVECSREDGNTLSIKNESTSVMDDNQQCKAKNAGGIFDGVVCSNLEVDTGGTESPVKILNIMDVDKKIEVSRDLLVPCDLKEASLQSQPVDDSESDVLEHDVKVCDICGDAGREDLLAVCCRCADGAEHTYCMREMLDKIPEGDWLCEECKHEKDMINQKQDKVTALQGKTKDQSSGLVNSKNLNFCAKSEAKVSDVDGSRNGEDRSNVRVSCKRHADDAEVSSAAKKQAVEPNVGSPKTSNRSTMASLSRDSSFRNLDKGKVKPIHKQTPNAYGINDMQENVSSPAGPPSQTPRGTFMRSSSFNSTSKPKVKSVDEFPHKQKLARESGSLDIKDGASRLGKTMSFKSVNSGRANTGESKVKMISPRLSHVLELKGSKQKKERNSLERRNSFSSPRSERPLGNSATPHSVSSLSRVDKIAAFLDETPSHLPVTDARELRTSQSESKHVTFSKSTSYNSRRGNDIPISSVEVKRQSTFTLNVAGTLSANDCSSEEQKLNQCGLKDDSSSSSSVAERPFCNGNDNLPERQSCPQDSTNFPDRARESSTCRLKQGAMVGGRNINCQKCKQIGHSSQFCTAESPDAFAARGTKEEKDKGDRLRAAIEAAALKKPGIYKRNKVSDQMDELPALSLDNKNASQDRLPGSGKKTPFSRETVQEKQAVSQVSSAGCCMVSSLNNPKHYPPTPAVVTYREDSAAAGFSDEKSSMKEFSCRDFAEMTVLLNSCVIPEHEFIWQGGFEVLRRFQIPEFCDGIQAHLSTCASPKVVETSNKFPRKIIFQEVPRLSAWPIQFQENGVKEDNIALYFFAKDLESYDKGYKILLERMMKSDLALKGQLDGVELLVFPSNQLFGQFKRWNMLYFLWGVFRAKRVVHDLTKEATIFHTPKAIMSLPENICSLGPLDKDLQVSKRACGNTIASAPTSAEIQAPFVPERVEGNSNTFVCRDQCAQVDLERDNKIETRPLGMNQESDSQSCPKSTCLKSLEGVTASDCKRNMELEGFVRDAQSGAYYDRNEQLPLCSNTIIHGKHSSCPSNDKFLANELEISPAGSIAVQSDRTNCRKDETKCGMSFEKRPSLDVRTATGREAEMKHSDEKDMQSWDSNDRKLPNFAYAAIIPEAAAGTSQATTCGPVDGDSASNMQRVSFSGFYELDVASSSGDVFMSLRDDSSSGLKIETKRYEGCEKTASPVSSGNAERFFFPVDPRSTDEIDLAGSSISWKPSKLEKEEFQDRTPNLELALGAESKPGKQDVPPFLAGRVDKKINLDQFPDEATIKEEDDMSASLSLSLSFPFQDREPATNSVSKTERRLPGRRHVSSSMLFFGGLSDK